MTAVPKVQSAKIIKHTRRMPVNTEMRAGLKSQQKDSKLSHIDDGWIDTDSYGMSDDEYFSYQQKKAIRKEKWNNFKKAFKDLFR